MSDPVEQKLYDAARAGRASEVSSLLRDYPEINVNWTNDIQWTALHAASFKGHAEAVKLLLAHPDIKVNLKNDDGQTPLSLACEGSMDVFRLLWKDPHIDVTLEDRDGRTPLWYASCNGKHEMIEWLIASGRDLGDVKNKKGNDWDGQDYTALEIARFEGETDIVSLLEIFIADSAQTRHDLRVQLGMLDELAAEVFALTVFLCDDLLQLKPALSTSAAAASAATFPARFFTIVKRLPMELQMILCHFAVGSIKQNILRKDSEAAFKSLARILPFPAQGE